MMMGFTKINLDLITSIIASVAVGVGIDYTIHFLTTYREERSKTDETIKERKCKLCARLVVIHNRTRKFK